MEQIQVRSHTNTSLKIFLESHDYTVTLAENSIWQVTRDELEVYLKLEGKVLYFEVDLGKTEGIISEVLYRDLLVLNTKILPVSLGLDLHAEERLILLESREIINLDDNEILAVFEAMEIAVLKVTEVLKKHIKTTKK